MAHRHGRIQVEGTLERTEICRTAVSFAQSGRRLQLAARVEVVPPRAADDLVRSVVEAGGVRV